MKNSEWSCLNIRQKIIDIIINAVAVLNFNTRPKMEDD